MAKLNAWYKEHSNRNSARTRLLVVMCPAHGKVCAVEHVCRVKKPERDHVVERDCEFWDGMGFGYIKCNHPKAGKGETNEN